MTAIKREERIGGQRLILGDCLDVMKYRGRCDIGPVDSVVSDPPYGIGFKYNSHIDSAEQYPEMMRAVITAATALEPHTQAYWQGMPNADKWHTWFPSGFRIYAACKGFVQIRPVPVQYSWDPVIFWTSRVADGKTSSRDWSVQLLAPFGAGRWKNPHPCPRPIEQCSNVVKAMSNKDDVVLDPFMGSGTTLVACQRLGRRGTGIEIDPEYFEIACRRVDEATRQPDLFIAPPETPTQEAMDI